MTRGLDLATARIHLRRNLLIGSHIRMTNSVVRYYKVFDYKFRPIRIVDKSGDSFDIVAHGDLYGASGDEAMELCQSHDLRAGLFLYKADSHSEIIAEFRAIQVIKGSDAQTFRAKFSIPRSYFDEQQCRLAKIDLLYEHQFWFEEKLGARPFLPIWVEKSAKELDVFAYYQEKYMKR